jgi:predicted transglutaminase-like cysteine proteinase
LLAGLLIGAVYQELTAHNEVRVASPYLGEYGFVEPPYAWRRMCVREPEQCDFYSMDDAPPSISPYLMYQLGVVNLKVNEAVIPVTDTENYGSSDYWTLPDLVSPRGDCEDVALLKRAILMRLGWPKTSLRMTVVLDHNGDGHAVLTVRSEQGDYVLDNKIDDVRLWGDTGYAFVSRESGRSRMWSALFQTKGERS